MGTKLRSVRSLLFVVVTCCASALVGAVTLSPAASARSATETAVSRCTARNAQGTSNMEVWLGDGLGGGVLGGYYYPLEITNVGRRTCTLDGYPGLSAYRGAGTQIGPAALRVGGRHRTVVLAPGATAHSMIRISDWGALCSRKVEAAGLKVFPPGQTISQTVPFPFGACAHRGVLWVEPLRAGVGIPGYTIS
jgi:Domain of unknown function (DUF4232)